MPKLEWVGKDNYNAVFEDVSAIIERKQGELLSPQLHDALQSTLKNEIHQEMASIFETGKRRLKLYLFGGKPWVQFGQLARDDNLYLQARYEF